MDNKDQHNTSQLSTNLQHLCNVWRQQSQGVEQHCEPVLVSKRKLNVESHRKVRAKQSSEETRVINETRRKIHQTTLQTSRINATKPESKNYETYRQRRIQANQMKEKDRKTKIINTQNLKKVNNILIVKAQQQNDNTVNFNTTKIDDNANVNAFEQNVETSVMLWLLNTGREQFRGIEKLKKTKIFLKILQQKFKNRC